MTSPERTFLDLATVLGTEALVSVGDAILHNGLTTMEALAESIATGPRRNGMRPARAVLPLLDGRAQSAPETVLRLRLVAAGLAAVPQCPVVDGDGVVIGNADLGLPRHRVAVEYEGRHHADGEQFDYDIGRYSAFAAAGWLVVRCGRRDLAGRSELLVRRVQAAVASR